MTEPPNEVPSVVLSNEETWYALLPRLRDLVINGRFTLGPELEEFERAAARQFGGDWCVGTSSGTSALTMALRAGNLPANARVALPANTFFATFEAVIAAGFRPVLIDHDEDYLIDLAALDSVDVDAVIPVHLYGLPVDMNRLVKLARLKAWWLVEDCAQAQGASINGRSVGSFGGMGAFSAYPTKNLGAWGDAGFIVGRGEQGEHVLRALRHHGQVEPHEHRYLGATDRMDNLQALVLSHKLTLLSEEVEKRRQSAKRYRDALSDLELQLPDDRGSRRHVYHQFVIRIPNRDEVRRALQERGISTAIHYPRPIHRQPAAEGLFEAHGALDRTERWSDEILSLPMHKELTDAAVDHVATVLTTVLGAYS